MGNKIDRIYNTVVVLYLVLVMMFIMACNKVEVDNKYSGEVIVKHVIDLQATAQGMIDVCNQVYTQDGTTDLQTCIEQQLTSLNDLLKNLAEQGGQ